MTSILAQTTGLFTTAGLAAAGAAAMSIPIIIHLLTRMRRKPQQWGAMKFLLEAYRRQRTRLRLEQWLLLLVRCLILLMLGLALAGPLLGGCARNVGLSTGGRVIYLVIDDSLSASTTAAPIETAGAESTNATRFERQRKLALALLDGLVDGDKVAVYRAARPVDPLVATPTLDRNSVRRLLTQLGPRMGKADLINALRDVRSDLDKQNVPADHAFVVVLSDFAPDAAAVDQTIPDALNAFDQHARLLFANPETAATNIQVSALKPDRHLVITRGYSTADGSIRLPISLQLKRFADESATRVSNAELALIGEDPAKPLHVFAKETYRWPAGEQTASLRRNLIVPGDVIASLNLNSGSSSSTSSAGASLVLRATIEPDALEADNSRSTLIELRRQVRAGVIGDNAAGFGREDKQISPDRWLSIALAPIEDGPIEVRHLPAIDIDEIKLAPLDVAMITRPDLISEAGWRGLKKMIDRGGLVWLFAPHQAGASQWGDAVRSHFGVAWEIGIDPVVLATPPDPNNNTAPPPSADGKGVAVDRPTPELLAVLAADWKALLGPVRIKQHLPINATAGSDQVWLALEDNQPLLLSERVGRGRLVLLGTSLDNAWSNLPTKPLFPPLLHETLQATMANSGEAGRLSLVTVGDTPALGKTWDGVAQLKLLEGNRQKTDEQNDGVLLRRTEAGYEPVDALPTAGIYVASPETQGRLIAVNVDAAAGDTSQVERALLESWLKPLGQLAWIESDDPLVAFRNAASRANIGWHLLWITLVLVVLEAWLARSFSHANDAGKVGAATLLYHRFVGRQKEGVA